LKSGQSGGLTISTLKRPGSPKCRRPGSAEADPPAGLRRLSISSANLGGLG